MEEVLSKLDFTDLKPYVTSSRSCKFGTTCIMDPKFGILVLDFSAFVCDRCVFVSKRISGNGKLAVICGDKVQEISVLSQSSHSFSVDLQKNKTIQLKRTHDSAGQIELTQIILYKNIEEYIMTDWGKILNSCKHKGIRVVSHKLLATEGAFITAEKINDIQTNPPNAFSINENTIKFLYQCEITKLNINKLNLQSVTFKTLDQSCELEINKSSENSYPTLTIPVAQKLIRPPIVQSANPPNNLIYDSANAGWFTNGSITYNESVEISNNVLKFNHTGLIRIKIPTIQANTNYIALVETNKVNGNGKLSVSIKPSQVKVPITLISPVRKMVNFNVRSGDGDSFSLEIMRPHSATGTLIVSRVLVLTSLVSFEIPPIPTFISNISTVISDNVETLTKSFASIKMENFTPNTTFDTEGVIEPLTYNSNIWVNKILPFFPNIKAKSNMLERRGLANSNLVIGELNSLNKAPNIWIEEFIDRQVSSRDKEILSSCKNIFSSSLPNVQFLRRHFNNIQYVPKIWPWVQPKKYLNKNNYILYFNRNPLFTKELIKHVNANLVIVGGRGSYGPNIDVIGSYLPHDMLVHTILNAGCVIDLPTCNHYMSGLLDFCFIAGIPIITNNHWMSISKPKQFHVSSIYKNGLIPKFDELPVLVDKALKTGKKPHFDMSTYNLNLKALMANVMEIS